VEITWAHNVATTPRDKGILRSKDRDVLFVLESIHELHRRGLDPRPIRHASRIHQDRSKLGDLLLRHILCWNHALSHDIRGDLEAELVRDGG
jgi:hypothetical protein